MDHESTNGATLAHEVDGIPERFLPDQMKGQLVEAEHMARYWWATRFCQGKRVLDAGCGMGYGAAMLSSAGATAVEAVDIAEAVVEAARARVPDGVNFRVADVKSLPFDDGSFDLVVCFETIEHVDEQDIVLAELARVLAPGGLLVISSPNRARYVPGNPHHVHENLPEELRAALQPHFAAVRLCRQHVMLASVMSGDEDAPDFAGAPTRRMVAPGREDQIYTVAMAGDHLPDPGPPVVALTQFVELRRWLEFYEQQRQAIRSQERALEELDVLKRDRQSALTLLAQREQELAELPTLHRDLSAAEREAERLRSKLQVVRGELDALRASASWRLTSPLRQAKHAAQARRLPR